MTAHHDKLDGLSANGENLIKGIVIILKNFFDLNHTHNKIHIFKMQYIYVCYHIIYYWLLFESHQFQNIANLCYSLGP